MMFNRLEAHYGAAGARLRARRIVVACWAALAIVALASGMMLAGASGDDALLPVLVRLLPLVLVGVVFSTERRRGYGWLAFVALLYLFQGAAVARLPGFWWIGGLEVLTALALCTSAVSYMRHIRRWQQSAG